MIEKIEKIFLFIERSDIITRFKCKNKLEKVVLIMLFFIGLIISLKLLNIIKLSDIVKYFENNMLWIIALLVVVLLLLYTLFKSGRTDYELKVCNFREVDTEDERHNRYKCILENVSSKDILLKSIIVQYKYYKGDLCSIGNYELMNYNEKYLVYLDIDTSDDSIKQSQIIFNNEILLRKKNYDNTNYFDFELNLVYRMIELDYHPFYDWNIIFNVYVVGVNDKKYEVIRNKTWREFSDEDYGQRYLISCLDTTIADEDKKAYCFNSNY